MTGNTEEIAEIIEVYLTKLGIQVERFQIGFDAFQMEKLLDADGLLIGTYTDGDGELPYEAEDFQDELEKQQFQGLPIGLFGSCDSMYPIYGGAIDLIADTVEKCGATLPVSALKIELAPEAEDIKKCEAFASKFIEKIHE